MKKVMLAVAVLATMIFSTPAKADSVQLVGVAGYTSASGSVYTAPYALSDSSILGGADISVICDSYNNEVSINEIWAGTTHAFSSIGAVSGGLFSSTFGATAKYDEAVILYSQFMAGPLNSTTSNAYSYATWKLFDPTATAYNFVSDYNASGAAAILAGYSASEAATFNFTGYELITPTTGDSGSNPPQEYVYDDFAVVTSTPEPGSLLLFGSGMLGLAGFLRRKLVS
jgi:hypothetical protein